ncbi:hypothetical protein KCU98_g5099, partial [Aureobasidium melanogenum]
MSFSDLPPAILFLVASHLKEEAIWLAQYASINRPWQSVVEALTFRELRTESIEHLRQIPQYMNRDRWDAMRSLDVIVHLPEYERERWYQIETNEDKQINNAIFSDFMMKLFETVNTWEQYRNDAPRFTLAIQAISMSDYWHLGRLNRMKRYANATRGAEDIRIQASYLRLTGNLPSLSAISGLIVRGARNVRIIKPGRSCCPRLLSGESVCRIVRACPNVNKAEVDLSDQESKDLGLRNAERSAFATSFTGLPQGLRHLKISYPGVVPANQLFSPPSIPVVDGKDFLSYRLNMISRQLQYLEIKAVLSDDFFDMTDPATAWPLLQSLSIDFDPCTPSGDWMLELDPTDSDVEPDHERAYEFEVRMGGYKSEAEWPAKMHFPRRSFRTAVNSDILDDISLAAARALTKMPSLRDLKLNVGDGQAETGCLCSLTSDGRSSHKVVWRSRSATMYEPHADVIAAWKQVFAERTGELEIQVIGPSVQCLADSVPLSILLFFVNQLHNRLDCVYGIDHGLR